jgi:hypothetical protein
MLGEHHVEGDHDGSLLGEPVDQARHDGARPWPLAVFGERLLVDVDDAHRRGGIVGAGLQPLIAVESEVAHARQFRRIDGAQQERVDQHEDGHDPRRAHIAPAKQPSHAHSAVVPLHLPLY